MALRTLVPTLTLVVAACGGGSGGGPSDAGGSARGCPMSFAGCTKFDDDRGSANAAQPIFVAFQQGNGPTVYVPDCILINAGQSVVLPAGSANPLENASCTPADSPIPATPAEGSMEYTFANAGNYGFQSATMGFQGLIEVQ